MPFSVLVFLESDMDYILNASRTAIKSGAQPPSCPARRKPATEEMFVLWGGGLVIKRVEFVNLGTGSGAGNDGEAPRSG